MATPKKESTKDANESSPSPKPTVKVARRLTIANAYGTVSMIREAATSEGHAILEVLGIATGSKVVNSKLPNGDVSESIAMLGEFTGRNLDTGAVTYAAVCFLPEPVPSMTAEKLKDESIERVEVALRIGVKTDARSVTGYVYETEPLRAYVPSPALLQLTADLNEESSK